MTRPCIALLALAATVAPLACERPGGEAERGDLAARAMRGALAYPQSVVSQVSSGTDAAEVTLSTTAPPDSVARWYREALVANGWELRSDQQQPNGTVVIFAEKGESPLWVTLRPNTSRHGTIYTLVGVVLEGDSIR